MVIECDDLGAVDWRWQAADSCTNKSRFDGDKRGPNPTDRAKLGTKKSLIVERSGGPLGVEIAGANVHDKKLLKETIEAIVVDRPDPHLYPQRLLLDKGYDRGRDVQAVIDAAGYIPHIRRIGDEKLGTQGRNATRHAAGSSSARSHGCRSAGPFSSATTRRPTTTSGCSSSPAHCSGIGAYIS